MKNILLVDDDLQVRTMFGLALRRNGYHVLEATSGAEALLLARQHLPELILSDIHMPGGDGSTLLHAIRQDPELRTKQVVLMTGRPDLVTPRKGMEDGADDFLVKPVGLDALLSCVKARFSRASISWRVEDETVAKLKSLVPANLPHECFTPLTGIIGLTEILLSEDFAFSPTEIKEIYKDIHLSAFRLHRTLRNYLLILGLETASPKTSPPLSTGETEKRIQAGISEALRLNNRQGDVHTELSGCSISVQSTDLTRMVEELVDNACKFSRQGTPVEVKLESSGVLTVTDQGRGMTDEEIKSIGAFCQFDRKKHEQQGLGLGLVLVQKIAALYQAEFSLQSQPGAGTQVKITFPLAKPT